MATAKILSRVERLTAKPYEQRICRSEYYPLCLAYDNNDRHYPTPTMEEHLDLMKEVGLEVQIIGGEHDRGTPYHPSKMLPPYEHARYELIPQFLELAHQRDILVIAYYPMIYTKPLKPMHPEWLMQWLDDDRPEGIGPGPENLGWFCFNSPYRDWIVEYLCEYLDHLDLDGFFFDDMNWGSHEGQPLYTGCVCDYCREIYNSETGREIPLKVNFDSVDFRRFVVWRYDKVREFLAHVVSNVRKRHPLTIMDFNYYAEQAKWGMAAPINPLGLEKVGGYFFIESGWGTIEHRGGFSAKVAQAHGSPFGLWRSTTQDLSGSCWGFPPHAEPYSPALYGLTAIAHGGGFFFCGMQYAVNLRADFIKRVFSEVKQRTPFMGGETVKYVALHLSQRSIDFLPAEFQFGHRDAELYDTAEKRKWAEKNHYVRNAYADRVRATYAMLGPSQLLTDVVFDEHLTEDYLKNYKVLFLSNSVCLSGKQCAAVENFVHQGGTLIATHQTSLLDEIGVPRDNFGLAELFGLDYAGLEAEGKDHAVVYVLQDQNLIDEFGPFMCFTGRASSVTPRAGSELGVIATRCSIEAPNPVDHYDPNGEYDSGDLVITVRPAGEGEVIYINGDVGGSFERNPYPALKRFVARIVERVTPPIEVRAPKTIEVTAAIRESGELQVHLINNPAPHLPDSIGAAASTHFFVEEPMPVHDVDICFNDFDVDTARLPLAGVELEVRGSVPSITVPRVELHEVVVVDLKS